jgi:integrase
MSDGSRRRQRVYGKTRDEVFEKLSELQRLSRQGIPMPSESWTVDRYLEYWLEHVVRPTAKPKTHQGYEVVVRVHLVPVLGRKRLKGLQAADVRRLLAVVEHRCRCCAEGIDARRPVKKRKCCAVGDCCESLPSVHALYVLTLYLGMRRAELLGLRWSDVDLTNGTLEIVQTLQRVDGELRFVPAKTLSSERTVPLIGLCVEALRAHKAKQAWEASQAGEGRWTDSGLVFTSTVGTPIEPDNLRRSWHPLRASLGLGPVRFHDLRHTCVSLLLDLGVPPHIVREIVGHADIGVTMNIYAHASLAEKRAALLKLDERLR